MYVLSTGDIPEDADAPGLSEAREKLRMAKMTKAELEAYYKHLDNVVILRDNIETARGEGKIEGHFEGLMEGREEGRKEGRKEGLMEGRKEGLVEGRKEGLVEGRKEGLVEGREEGRKEGLMEGRKEGLMEGRMEEKMANALSLKRNGIPVAVIAKSLGLSEQEIEQLG